MTSRRKGSHLFGAVWHPAGPVVKGNRSPGRCGPLGGSDGASAAVGLEAGGELVPPIQTAVNYAFPPIGLDHPDPFGATVVLMEEDGYSVRLAEVFAR
ncbi:hypothetical protein GCM10020227_22820 [Streptomyces flavovirens]